MTSETAYRRRVVDQELDELLLDIAACVLDGPKGVGKTATALQRARTVISLDLSATRRLIEADPTRLTSGHAPILVDEWQRFPESWDRVRRAVDAGASPGTFLLTGSASPTSPPAHSGAGRIVRLRMRPLSLAERGIEEPTVSLRALLSGRTPTIAGHTLLTLDDYAAEIVTSGFPGIRRMGPRARRSQLDSYVDAIIDRDFPDQDRQVRNPAALRRWMTAYAAASSTTASYETIRDAATSGEGKKPAKTTTQPYRDILERLWVVDPLPAWAPTRSHLSRLVAAPKHQLADPAIAARLLGASEDALLDARPLGPAVVRDSMLVGQLFESLVTMSLRTYAQVNETWVKHLRTQAGLHEIDLIVERADHRVVALEVKLSHNIRNEDVRHLLWLKEQLGPDLLDMVVVTAGADAYRRQDGVVVVPAALLGP